MSHDESKISGYVLLTVLGVLLAVFVLAAVRTFAASPQPQQEDPKVGYYRQQRDQIEASALVMRDQLADYIKRYADANARLADANKQRDQDQKTIADLRAQLAAKNHAPIPPPRSQPAFPMSSPAHK